MLKKADRLGRVDFDTFFKKGRRFHSEYATLVYSPHSTFHASVVIGKKVHKQAVIRNTLRRRIYAQLAGEKKKGTTGVYVVVLKPSFKTLTRLAAQREIESLVERIPKPA